MFCFVFLKQKLQSDCAVVPNGTDRPWERRRCAVLMNWLSLNSEATKLGVKSCPLTPVKNFVSALATKNDLELKICTVRYASYFTAM